MRWFRLYSELVDDPKVQRLPPDLFKALINLWCLASQNSGRLPDIDDITFRLRYVTRDVTVTVLSDLEARGFIDRNADGWCPHNWSYRQPTMDDVALRMRKYRKRKQQRKLPLRNALHNQLHDGDATRYANVALLDKNREEKKGKTLLEDSPSVSSPDLSKSLSGAKREKSVTRIRYDAEFEEIWKAYPPRDGANPKLPAFKKFKALLKSGIPLEAIQVGAKRYRKECDDKNRTGTPYVPQMATWLNQQRFEAYQPAQPINGHARDPPTAEKLEIGKKMAAEGAKLFDEFGYLKPGIG